MSDNNVTRFLGDSLSRTLVKLAVISFVVGIIMSAFNFTPLEVWYAVRNFMEQIYNLGFEAFGRIGKYFLYGAIVVIPVFLLLRLTKFRP